MDQAKNEQFEKDVDAYFNGKYADGILHWDFADFVTDFDSDPSEVAAQAIRRDVDHCFNFYDYDSYFDSLQRSIGEEASGMFRAKSKELNLYCGKEDEPFSSFDSLAKHYGFKNSAEMAEAFYEKAENDHVEADYALPSVDCEIMLDLGARNGDFGVIAPKSGKSAELDFLIKSQGYDPDEFYKALDSDQGYTGSSKFLQSLQSEIRECMCDGICRGGICLIGSIPASDYVNLAYAHDQEARAGLYGDFKPDLSGREEVGGSSFVTLDRNCACGIYSPQDGGGSLMEVELEKPVKIPLGMCAFGLDYPYERSKLNELGCAPRVAYGRLAQGTIAFDFDPRKDLKKEAAEHKAFRSKMIGKALDAVRKLGDDQKQAVFKRFWCNGQDPMGTLEEALEGQKISVGAVRKEAARLMGLENCDALGHGR